jgi:hypothetical protein
MYKRLMVMLQLQKWMPKPGSPSKSPPLHHLQASLDYPVHFQLMMCLLRRHHRGERMFLLRPLHHLLLEKYLLHIKNLLLLLPPFQLPVDVLYPHHSLAHTYQLLLPYLQKFH